MKALEGRVPPLFVVAIIGAAMWGARACVPGLTAFFPGRLAIAFVVLALGLAVIAPIARIPCGFDAGFEFPPGMTTLTFRALVPGA